VVLFFTDIIHHFGVPNSIITDNGTQFTGRKFLEFCDDYHIHVDWSAVAHPKTNGQVERANGMILQGLKPRIFNRLNKFGRKWLAELPSVIWSLRTTPSRATGSMPFFMVYGSKAVLPADLEYGAPRIRAYNEQENQTTCEEALDQLDEARDVALLHSAKYQQALRRYHSRRIRGRALNVGDLVLRLKQSNKGRHKLTPPWEDPFIVAEVLKPRIYKLANENGEIFTNAWNIEQLRPFTLKLPSFVHIFISKAIKKRSLLIALSRIDLDPLAGTEVSLLNHVKRARPGPATSRIEPPSGARGDPLGPNDFFTTFSKKTSP
jgi:transposase InsO family protein